MLVATGDHDMTTHAGSSAFVADRIQEAHLPVEPGGSHAAFFGKPAPLALLAHTIPRRTRDARTEIRGPDSPASSERRIRQCPAALYEYSE